MLKAAAATAWFMLLCFSFEKLHITEKDEHRERFYMLTQRTRQGTLLLFQWRNACRGMLITFENMDIYILL